MIVHTDCDQGSLEWLALRAGIPTASEFDNLVTSDFRIRTGEMPKTYLAKKVAEVWQGGPLPSYTGFDMDQGKILEEEALPWFSLETGIELQRVAFITTDDKRIGCSPDALIGDDGGLETKCPAVHTHVGYLLNGTLPKDYAAQVHGSMLVTGRPWWKFLSYCRNFPPLVLTIERNEVIIDALREALNKFNEQFDAAMKRMEEINGGPPRKFQPMPSRVNAQSSAKPYVLHELEVTP